MPGLFHSLNTSYSGLKTTQTGINTVSHNIANAGTEGYTREKAVQATAYPLHDTHPADLGSGVKVSQIARIKDSFVFDRLKHASEDKEKLDVLQENLIKLSKLFPDIDNVGLKKDIGEYFKAWSTLSQNPANTSIKINLASKTENLVASIKTLYQKVTEVRAKADDRIKTTVNEVNSITERISKLNHDIYMHEADGVSNANDLRDKRDLLELKLSKLLHITVSVGAVKRDSLVGRQMEKREGYYNISFGGISLVDGLKRRELFANNDKNKLGFNDLYYLDDNFNRIAVEKNITGGRLGALIGLRGTGYNDTTKDAATGRITELMNNLNDFSKTLIESTNSVYAQSVSDRLVTNRLHVDSAFPLVDQKQFGIKDGSFDIIMYDAAGNKVMNRKIKIDDRTSLSHGNNSIMHQLQEIKDDNNDNVALNDFKDYFDVFFDSQHRINIMLRDKYRNKGLKLSMSNDTTNFVGFAGFNRFFDGHDARDIKLNARYKEQPIKISGNIIDKFGDNKISNDMVALQYKRRNYKLGGEEIDANMLSYYDIVSSKLATETESITTNNDTSTARLNSVEKEYKSISGVNVDEELTHLMKYQTAYNASAKVVSTVDKMLDTLLNMSR